ncbi:hypothetical protein HK104_002801 [Borealophlyctis nickersoniae]|nr:hypothetical protein HK104_002801 [Borealophlyctis nickersoniae]
MVCVEYSGLNMAQEQEIFNRVQLGMALTTAEKMYSSLGPLADFVRKLIKDHDELFKIVDSKRKRTFQILVQAYITVQTSPEKLPSGTVMNKWLKEEKPNNQMKALMDGVFRVFTKMWEEYPKVFQEVQNKKTNLWEVKKLAPIEFVMICYLIATKDALPVKQLQAKVGEMRTRIRSQFIDIRSNQRLYDAMKGIIDSM